MVQLNLALREINCKIVYFGPGLSGKTTNLEIVHERAPKEAKGDLTSIATESDRTLFFDFMPLSLGTVGGMKTKFQLYTVPGQVYYNSTRKLVLRGADGVVFVADSSPEKMEENIESLDNLEECLREQGRCLAETPHVIQFNKRDLPGALSIEEMGRLLNRHGAPCVEAVASKGEGVIETFKSLSGLVLDKVKGMSKEKSEAKPAAAAPASGSKPMPGVAPRPERQSQSHQRPAVGPPPRTGGQGHEGGTTATSQATRPAASTGSGTGSHSAAEAPRPVTGSRPQRGAEPARRVSESVPVATATAPPRMSPAPGRTPISPQIAVNPGAPPAPARVKTGQQARSQHTSSSQTMILSSSRRGQRRSAGIVIVMVLAAAATAVALAWYRGLI